MKIFVLSLFPQYFESALKESILKRAQAAGKVSIALINIRDFAHDKHKVTDDRPFGGGAGMVLKVEPIDLALQSVKNILDPGEKVMVVLTSAKGRAYTQAIARDYATVDTLILICGHYEGVDERVALQLADQEICIGEYVLTGGEPAALVILDSVVRLVPGVLGNEESVIGESHDSPGLKGYPQYTRPVEYRGWQVPPVLLSGDHKKITNWREENRARE